MVRFTSRNLEPGQPYFSVLKKTVARLTLDFLGCGLRSELLFILIATTTLSMKEVLPCSESEFYIPYAKVKRTITSDEILTEAGPGFSDLSASLGASLCLNGPAIVYTEVHKDETKGIDEYYNGHFSVYVHNCFPLNEIGNTVPKQSKRSIVPKPKKKSIRFQAYGLTLVGGRLDYRQEQIYQFNHPNFGHNANGMNKNGTSFVIIGDTCWCTTLPGRTPSSEVNDITICGGSRSERNPEICTVRGDEYEGFNALFTKTRETKSYSWTKCERNDKPIANVTPNTIQKPGLFTFENFAFLLNSSTQNHSSSSNESSHPRVRHCWKIEATDCFPIPDYFPEIRC